MEREKAKQRVQRLNHGLFKVVNGAFVFSLIMKAYATNWNEPLRGRPTPNPPGVIIASLSIVIVLLGVIILTGWLFARSFTLTPDAVTRARWVRLELLGICMAALGFSMLYLNAIIFPPQGSPYILLAALFAIAGIVVEYMGSREEPHVDPALRRVIHLPLPRERESAE